VSFLRRHRLPRWSTPWTWNRLFPTSIPIVTGCMVRSSIFYRLRSTQQS